MLKDGRSKENVSKRQQLYQTVKKAGKGKIISLTNTNLKSLHDEKVNGSSLVFVSKFYGL